MALKMLHLHLLKLLFLLFALFQPIVCPNAEMATSRRDRSSYVDTSHFISDNFNSMSNESNEPRSIKTYAQHQHKSVPSQHLHQHVEAPKASKLNNNMLSLFVIGPEKGVKLFNNTYHTGVTPAYHHNMQGDDTLADKSLAPNQEQLFKVQRSPDGKLNLVFNDFVYLQNHSTEATPTKKPKNDGILFPDQYHDLTDIESKCDEGGRSGKPFCYKVRDYPKLEHLDSILKQELAQIELFFGTDEIPPSNVSNRMNYEPDEEPLCRGAERIIYPEAGQTKDSNWLLIVNNNEKYKQGIRIEECLNEGGKCNSVISIPIGYRATCKQNYVYRSLVALTPNGTVTKDNFKMPSCCECVLKTVHN